MKCGRSELCAKFAAERTPSRNIASVRGSRTLPWLANPKISPCVKLFPNMGRAKRKVQMGSLLLEQHRDITGYTEGFFLPKTGFCPRYLGQRLVVQAAVSLQWHVLQLLFHSSSGCHIGEKS